MDRRTFLLSLGLGLWAWRGWSGNILEVGPGKALRSPSEAAGKARDGDLVIIQGGYYLKDTAYWPQDRLRIIGNGRVRLMSQGQVANGKAIWVLSGHDIEVRNCDFSGARCPDLNGAGIRFEGRNLRLFDCRFHDNEMGLLSSHDPQSGVHIERCAFYRNTVDYHRHGRLGHNLYIGRNKRLFLRACHSHDARTGHLIKSRARQNLILYNRICDENGHASYLIDLPEGGNALVMGNLLHKSTAAENRTAVAFAAEKNRTRKGQSLYVVNNSLWCQKTDGRLLTNHSSTPALAGNNLIQGEAVPLEGPGRALSNPILEDAGFRNPKDFDFRIRPDSLAINAGNGDLHTRLGRSLWPRHQYLHPLKLEPRPRKGPLDAGAYEYIPEE